MGRRKHCGEMPHDNGERSPSGQSAAGPSGGWIRACAVRGSTAGAGDVPPACTGQGLNEIAVRCDVGWTRYAARTSSSIRAPRHDTPPMASVTGVHR